MAGPHSKCGAVLESSGVVFEMTGSHSKWWSSKTIGLCSKLQVHNRNDGVVSCSKWGVRGRNNGCVFETVGLCSKWWGYVRNEIGGLMFEMTGSHWK
jgi:hypothetical protein